ncbi:MAG: Zn-dependent hydrolase [Cyanobacteria bacterium J06621_11]
MASTIHSKSSAACSESPRSLSYSDAVSVSSASSPPVNSSCSLSSSIQKTAIQKTTRQQQAGLASSESSARQGLASLADLRINGDRLMSTLAEVGSIGGLPNGGVRRLAFSPEDCQARDRLSDWMKAAGMSVRIDTAGNLIGRYPGRYAEAAAIATGSHLDTVPNAGIYDGTYGVLAGLEVVRTLYDNSIQLDHPLEVIVFADEERTMIGSKAMTGRASLDPAQYAHPHYEPIESSLSNIGGSWAQLPQAVCRPGELAAFVELHVEQGPVLEAVGNPIGLVTGIVGQRRYIITVEGQASHAGTTPMPMRQDALVAASQIVLAVNRIGCMKEGERLDPRSVISNGMHGAIHNATLTGDQVATVGAMKLSPNVANTIPGQIEMTLDIRDLSNDCLDRMLALLEEDIEEIAITTQTRIQLKPQLKNEPVLVNSHIFNTIAQSCKQLGLKSHALPSRASHDAQIIADITDMGMIFVPSQAGISHAETEYTHPAHCIQGTDVLLHTLLQLDQHYRCVETEQEAQNN